MRHGLQRPSQTPEERLQQRLANAENRPPPQTSGAVQTDWGGRQRILAGAVNTAGAGTALRGGGWSVSARTGAGDVTLAFTVPFSATPVVTATAEGVGAGVFLFVSQGTPGVSSCRLVARTGAGVNTDAIIDFQVVGPA